MIICPHTNAKGAVVVAEHMRTALSRVTLSNGTTVSASFGVADASSANTDEVIERADQALYKAKHNGRNRVVSADR